MKISGIILAGGKSSRMGKNKALVELKGTRLVQKSIDALQPICDEILLISNGNELGDLGYPVVMDEYKDLGPLGGIHAGLKNAANETCVVLSCDIPNIKTSILQTMLDVFQNENAVVAKCKDQVHPLVGVYRKSSVYDIETFIEKKEFKLQNCLEALKAEKVHFPESLEHCFANINTPSELETWQEK